MKQRIDRIRHRLSALEHDPRIVVLRNAIGEPATPEQIAEAEEALGTALPPELKELYQAANGVCVVWTWKEYDYWEDEDMPEYRAGFCDYGFIRDLDNGVCGALVIPPVSMLSDSATREFISLEEDDLDEAIPEIRDWTHVVPFDTYFFYNAAIVIWQEDKATGYVLIGDDHCASWSDFFPMEIGTYLDLTIGTWFTVVGRKQAQELFGVEEKILKDVDVSWTLDEALDQTGQL